MINYVGRKPEMPWKSLGEKSTEKFYVYKFTVKTKIHEEVNHGERERLWHRIYQKLACTIFYEEIKGTCNENISSMW